MLLRAFWTVLATAFTFAVIGLSMAMNLAFGYSLGTNPANARMLAGLSVACDGLKSLLPLFIAWQWAEKHRLAALAATLLFAAAARLRRRFRHRLRRRERDDPGHQPGREEGRS